MSYRDKAIRYAERYGIVSFTVKGNKMTYKEKLPLEKRTMNVTVNLDTMTESRKEQTRKKRV